MKIAGELLQEIVAHAQENPRIECCGVVAVGDPAPDGERAATRVYRAENIHASALKFEIDPMELLRLNNAIEDEGWEIGAIYHSHVRSAPYPSQTDIGFAASWPGVEWIIVGLAPGEQPLVRSYLIDGPDVREVAVEVDGSPAGSGAGAATGAAGTPS
ncbi:MAG: M67 family metallopeptidase [Solirubrobacteraceae bacterium]